MKFGVLVTLAVSAASAQGRIEASDRVPGFQDYPIREIFQGAPAQPVFATTAQKHYRSLIRNGVLKGEGVWNGSANDPVEASGPNFAGHYFVIRWGCGADCLMMAIVDAQTGRIYDPPLSSVGKELYMDILSDREIDFKRDSNLMILRNACQEARSGCGIYYFKWQNNQFTLVKRMLRDLTTAR